MTAKAISKYMRISPRKARLAADLIRGLPVEEASLQLQYCGLKSGRMLKKTLDSAVANAETQLDARREDLKVSEVRIDDGPTLKRAVSRSRGSRHPILKRTSHFTVVVSQG
jgi:large subunit ribosomal protein L22